MSANDRNSDNQHPEGLKNSAPLQTDHKPKLFLERPPGSAPYSQEEFDEIVPEFMHRDFYRSQEDAVEAIEPSGRLKAIRSRRRAQPPKPDKASQPMEPLRAAPVASSRQEPESAVPAEREALEPLREPRRPSDTVVIPRGESKSNINFPLVICLLFIVGLFLWREQTRPRIDVNQELPIPKQVPVSQELEDPSTLGVDSPYPEMSPGAFSEPEQEPASTTVGESTQEPTETVEDQPVTLPRETETAEVEDYPASEASAQRAAILERVSEGTVSRGSRESRMERDLSPSEAADSSLFPDMEGEGASTEAEAIPPASELPSEPEVTAVGSDDSSLFPEDSSGTEIPSEASVQAVEPPPIVPPTSPPSQQPTTGQGEPYQIAEPDL